MTSTVMWRRLAGNAEAAGGLVLLSALFLLAFAGPHLTKWDYADVDYAAFSTPPSAGHWFGTTPDGRDVYALTLRGMRRSLVIGLLVASISTTAAAVAGTVAGFRGGWADRLLTGAADLLLVLPTFLVVAIVSPLFHGGSWPLVAAVLAGLLWMITARVVRGMTISLKEREYVLAARYMGVSPVVIIVRHIVPHVASLLIVDAAMSVSAGIVAETGLSCFGFGVQPPDSSLGTVIADGTAAAVSYPWMFWFAAGLLVLIVLAVNLVGDGLRDALDPGSAPRRGR
ncbi:MAG TPA: ABC transporter permease [Streptosporangiaceae bacterium]|jgi:ABC-type dipeptide/oligopeptide/nickel transport system permease subunit